MALSKVDLANQVENQLPQGLVANNLPYRNIIINGDMSIAQRSTSVAGITTSGYNTLDRFQTVINSLGTWTQSQSTDVPSGQGFATSLKMDCTTADATPSGADVLILEQSFEGQNLQYLKKGTASAVSLTLSFWVKSTKTGTFIATLQDQDNSRTISKSYTVNVTNTWEKKTITFEGDTTGVLGNDNGASITLQLWLGAGTNYTSGTLATSWESTVTANRAVGQVNLADSTANDFYITGVQLEAGTSASDFEFLPYDVNLQRCQRYFISNRSGANANGSAVFLAASFDTNQAWGSNPFPVYMRVAPSITIYTFGSMTAGSAERFGGGTAVCSAILIGTSGFSQLLGSGTFTSGQMYGCMYEANAEL